jgi:hypothetical protein
VVAFRKKVLSNNFDFVAFTSHGHVKVTDSFVTRSAVSGQTKATDLGFIKPWSPPIQVIETIHQWNGDVLG